MKWVREPLVQFAALGAVLFAAYTFASQRLEDDEAHRIVMGPQEISFLADGWERQWQRPPTPDELRALVDARVREEVLYREARRLGLDVDDMVVKRRMVQKMELLSQDLALMTDPTDMELRSWFQENQDEYRVPPRVSFSHVYFNLDARGERAVEEARRALDRIQAMEPPPARAPELGDRFMLPYDYRLQAPLDVQRSFGAGFAEEVSGLEVGWHGPIGSGYGIHLVNVTERVESRIPAYEEIRDRLVNDYNRMRRDRANQALYEGLSEAYTVEIDEAALEATSLSGPGS